MSYRRNRDRVELELLRGISDERRDEALEAIQKTLVWQSAAFRDAIVRLGLALNRAINPKRRLP